MGTVLEKIMENFTLQISFFENFFYRILSKD